MNEDFADAFRRVGQGQRVKGRLEVGNLASGMGITQPYVIVRGSHDGPCLWINGSVHGTEINGVLAGLDFVNAIDPQSLKGSVIITPFANPMAIDFRQKNTPQDGQDLDQTFPGNALGQLSERLSASMFSVADIADVLVSMHTMGAPFNSNPYAVYKVHPNEVVSETQLLSHIRHFSPFVACLMNVAPGQGELPGNIAGAIDYQMLSRGKPAFMIELGGGSRVQEDFITQGVTGLRRMAASMGMLEAAESRPIGEICKVSKRHHVMCSYGGLFRPATGPGTEIPAGQSIGRVLSASGETLEEVTFEVPVKLIGIRSDPVVHSGDRVAFVATQWTQVLTAGSQRFPDARNA